MKKILTFVLAALVSVATFAGTLSCAEAVEVAQGLEPNTPSEDEYIVEGYVVSVIKSSATDLRFWMADDAAAEEGTFEAWVCTGDIVNKGDKVTVTGYIQWYVNEKDESDQKAEIANGTVVVVEPAPIDENYVEFNTGDFEGKGVSSTGGEISVTKNGVTVYTNGGYGHASNFRVYKNKSFSISADRRIVQIAFEFAYDETGELDPAVCVEGTEWGVSAMALKAYFNKIAVTLGDGECTVTPPVVNTITVAQAVEIGNALADGGKTTEKYVVEGYVVSSYPFDTEYNNQTFYMSDEMTGFGPLCAKWTTGDVVATITKDSEVTGDKVQVTGQIEKYNGNIQILRGVCKIISHSNLVSVKSSIKAKKVVENGQFMIEANGVRYNMLGARF